MSAGSIVVDLMMRTGAFETDTRRAEKRLAELKKEAKVAGAAIGAAFSAVAVAAAYMVKASIDSMDQMYKFAQQAGVNVEAFSSLSYAADLSGVSHEQLASAMTKLSKNMSDAVQGTGEAMKGFKALGIDVKNANGSLKSSDQVLTEIAGKLASYRDGTEKTALAVNLFGKAGAALIPMLNAGAGGLGELREEAERFGVVISTDAAKAAEEFNDDLSRLKARVEGVSIAIAGGFITSLNSLIAKFDEMKAQSTGGSLLDGIFGSSTASKFTSEAKAISADISRTTDSIERMNIELNRKGGKDSFLETRIKKARERLFEFQKEATAATQKLKDLADVTEPRDVPKELMGPPSSMAGKGAAPGIVGDAKAKKLSDFDRYLDSLQKQVQKTKELTEVETVLADIQAGRIKGITAGQKATLVTLAAQLDMSVHQTEQLQAEAAQLELLTAKRKETADAGVAVFEAMRTPMEKYGAEVARLNQLHKAGAIDVNTLTRATVDAADRLAESGEKAKETTDAMTEFAKQAERNIQDALGQTLEDSLSGNFDNIGQMWVKLIQKMAAQALAAKLNDALFGGGAGGDSGAFMKTILAMFGASSGASPTAYSNPNLYTVPTVGLAAGTNNVPRDNFPALLHKGEAVIPARFNTGNNGMGGGARFDFSGQTINVGSDVSRGEVRAAVMAGNAETEMRIRRSLKQQRGA